MPASAYVEWNITFVMRDSILLKVFTRFFCLDDSGDLDMQQTKRRGEKRSFLEATKDKFPLFGALQNTRKTRHCFKRVLPYLSATMFSLLKENSHRTTVAAKNVLLESFSTSFLQDDLDFIKSSPEDKISSSGADRPMD